MPRVTPEAKTNWYLFRGNKTEMARKTGITRETIYSRIKKPENITLRELAQLAKVNSLTDEQIITVVKAWE